VDWSDEKETPNLKHVASLLKPQIHQGLKKRTRTYNTRS